ncbi:MULTISPECIES: ABC transporter permease [unclassified Streptomyces]|uniref:ABC transporter permease n=1 Tax=unclassified Streptomyces TaxID=2593676 RepID=UPI002257CBB2|nr:MULTISPECIES: FtsX-like permease family protein [unclassified Streptomyces]MCX4548514.1 ABC transporter permease [Streptomyces sp. NBC_01500]WSC20123.1 ABC transporter permease [Streptomyces sp. NBC_01766]WSV54146.1 ABC transporter permease [Streptomyces sp. NBC_01014]
MSRRSDLAMGVRFAVAGGRESWVRTVLTAVGVALGVALLLTASSVPNAMNSRTERSHARTVTEPPFGHSVPRSDSTVLYGHADSVFRKTTVDGYLLRAEGKHPVVPPGISALPADGTMLVSPALKDLLGSDDGKLLRERLPYRIAGTIGDAGLNDPAELFYYAGSSTLTPHTGAHRLAHFGGGPDSVPLSPFLVVLSVLGCVVLLTPVAVFIATAVRFGSDRRDQRLASLRLVGADTRTTRRVAAGEAFAGAVLGVLLGWVFFLIGRELIGGVQVWNLSVFPSDLDPVPMLAALIVVAVPLSAIAVTLFAMRAVTVEPLGIARQTTTRRRRFWWRLVMPLAGLALLLKANRVTNKTEFIDPYPIAGGAILILAGLTVLLPWVVEAVVGRMRGGPVPFQLATRRLQLNSGSAARAVSGITVAVAGAVALQMYFAGLHDDFNRITGQNPARAQMHISASYPSAERAQQMIHAFQQTKGVKAVIGAIEGYADKPDGDPNAAGPWPTTSLTIGDCATLRELATLPSCEDGDSFVVHIKGHKESNDWVDKTVRPGGKLNVGRDGHPRLWTLPKSTPTVFARVDPMGQTRDGIFLTPSAIDLSMLPDADTTALVKTDRSVPDAADHVRNTAAGIDPLMRVWDISAVERDKQYASIENALLAASAATMVLIAASMLVSQLEQLRARKRLLSVLVAFGTRRTTLGWSVLWQTALPVVLGLALAVAGGLGLGAALLRLIGKSVTDWWGFVPLAGAGAGVILLVTLLSLPPLWRMMRPDGLRTE